MRQRALWWMVVAWVAFGWSEVSRAAPRWLRLSWTASPARSLTVSWTDGPGTGSAELKLPDGSTVTQDASTLDTGSSELETTYTVTFTGLEPETDYQYRVQSSGEWSNWQPARTAPAPGSCSPFLFVMGGDSRGQDILGHYQQVHWPVIAGLIAAEDPLFMLHSGDYVYSHADDSQWADELEVLPALSASHAFFLALGNHDTGPGEGDTAYYNRVFAYPKDNPDGVEDYYTFVVGNLQVVCLSTYTFNMDSQIAWLDQVLTEHENEVDWRVVFFHTPVWSSGPHGSNEDDRTRAEILLPVLEAHNVDIVLNGHDHDYERFHPSRGGYGTPREINPLPYDNGRRGEADGVIYIVSGGAGALVDPVFNQSEEGSAFGSSHLHYVVAQVSGSRMVLTVRDLGKQSLSSPQIQGNLEVVTLEKSHGICASGQDGGLADGGVGDGGLWDGEMATDGGLGDGGHEDAAQADGHLSVDAGIEPDSGASGAGQASSGCGCRASGGPAGWLWLVLFAWGFVFRRKRF